MGSKKIKDPKSDTMDVVVYSSFFLRPSRNLVSIREMTPISLLHCTAVAATMRPEYNDRNNPQLTPKILLRTSLQQEQEH